MAGGGGYLDEKQRETCSGSDLAGGGAEQGLPPARLSSGYPTSRRPIYSLHSVNLVQALHIHTGFCKDCFHLCPVLLSNARTVVFIFL